MLIFDNGLFVWKGDPKKVKSFKFSQYNGGGQPYTADPYIVVDLIEYARGEAYSRLLPLREHIDKSKLESYPVNLPAPMGLEYFDFQKAGVMYCLDRKVNLIGDEMGLGKTITSIALANVLRISKMLIVCPAGLRLNWLKELNTWHIYKKLFNVVLNGKFGAWNDVTTIISYDLVGPHMNILSQLNFDYAIIDEAQYLKNPAAQRTKNCFKLLSKIPRVSFLTGTPLQNNSLEIYNMVRFGGFHLIDNMNKASYERHFARIYPYLKYSSNSGPDTTDRLLRPILQAPLSSLILPLHR